MNQTCTRRSFLRKAGLFGLSLTTARPVAAYITRPDATAIRIASNPGLENATLNTLMEQQGYLKRFGVNAVIVQAPGTSGPFDAITTGAADVCMTSGYNMALARIEQGARVKIIGAGMRKTALTIYTRPDGIHTLDDLKSKKIALGPARGLLSTLMRQLMKEKHIDTSTMDFVDKGSNEQCYEAVARGETDACCASISHLNDKDTVVALREGNMWEALPELIFQTAYASDMALKDKHQEMIAVMAAYGALYDDLMSPTAHDAFFEARRRVQKTFDRASAEAIWTFNQIQQPYSRDLPLTEADVDYLQEMYLAQNILQRKQPFSAVADMSCANAAAEYLRQNANNERSVLDNGSNRHVAGISDRTKIPTL